MKNKKPLALFLIPLVMFGFGYLMVPIYNVFCDLTGLNGKTGAISTAQAARLTTDSSRVITIEFMGNLNQDTALDFAPAVRSMQVHPGRSYRATFNAHNQMAQAMVGQAVPSVSPAKAARYFNKTECFCFAQQPFAAGERRALPLIFVVDPDLPDAIETITLSYTFFDVTPVSAVPAPGHDHGHDHPTEPVHL